MTNLINGLVIIFIGGLAGYLARYSLNYMITGTDLGSEILTKFVPVGLFFSFLVFGFLVMIGKKNGNQKQQ
jgi:hypothetical protein